MASSALKPDLIVYINTVIAAPARTKNVYGVPWQDQVREIAKATGTATEGGAYWGWRAGDQHRDAERRVLQRDVDRRAAGDQVRLAEARPDAEERAGRQELSQLQIGYAIEGRLQLDRTYTSTTTVRTRGAGSAAGPVGVYVLSSCISGPGLEPLPFS
jgi:hypothetical protein